MLGIKYLKAQPTVHVMQFRNGQMVRSGVGESFFYFAPLSTIVRVPVATMDAPFMLELVTADFQTVTVQGQVGYRISDVDRIAALLDFSMSTNGHTYASDDPERLQNRIVTVTEIAIQQFLQSHSLKEVLNVSVAIANSVHKELGNLPELAALGVEINGVAIQAVKPTPDIARALEAEAREANLKAADDAVYHRRIAGVENEQSIRQKELETEVAVQEKQKQIEEAKMDTKTSVAMMQSELKTQQITADIELEGKRKELVANQTENMRTTAEAESFRLDSIMGVFKNVDPKTIQFLASAGMKPDQLIAQAFTGMAENAGKIGQLNMSPDLLQGLLGESHSAGASTNRRSEKSR